MNVGDGLKLKNINSFALIPTIAYITLPYDDMTHNHQIHLFKYILCKEIVLTVTLAGYPSPPKSLVANTTIL